MRNLYFALLNFLVPATLWASSGSQGMPWESPMQKIVSSLTGPIAAGISTLAFFIALASLAFGQDLSGFVRSLVILVLVVSGLLSIASVINMLFGVSGAIY